MISNAHKLITWITSNPPPNFKSQEASELFTWILWIIHAPHDLEYFEDIINQLPSILLDWEKLDPIAEFILDNHSKNKANKAVDLLAYLSANHDEIEEFIPAPKRIENLNNNRHPMHSRLGKYYVYAAMISSLQEDNLEHEDAHNYIKLVVLYCHHYLKSVSGDTHDDYLDIDTSMIYQDHKEKSRTINACRFIRKACYKDYATYLNDIESQNFRPIRELYSYVQNSKGRDRSQFDSIFNPFLDLIVNESNQTSRGGKGGGGRRSFTFSDWHGGYVRSSAGFYKEETYLDDDHTADVIVTNEAETDEEIAADLVADENVAAEEIIFLDIENQKSRGVIQKSQIKHIAVANQMLPFAWSGTTIFELTDLLKNIGKTFREDSHSSETEQKEALLVLLIMLVTGEQFERVISNFRFQNENKKFLPNKIYYVQGNGSQSGFWRIHPQLAKQQYSLTNSQRSLCGKRVLFIELPDVLNIGGYIIKTFTRDELANLYRRKVFRRPFETYKKILLNYFKKNCQPNNRINIDRVRNILFNIVVSHLTGDTSDGTLITGKYHPLSKTKLHYTTLEVSHLQKLYTHALKWMAEQVYLQGYDKPSPHYLNYEAKNDAFIGSSYNPLIESVSRGISKLIERLSSQKKPTTKESIREFHNTYTLYTVLFVGFGTGYRAITDPFPATLNIDEETGLCVISDKDGPDFYNTRLVWLPDILITQLKHYQEHQDVIRSYLLSKNKNLNHIANLPKLFFLDEEFSIEPVRPLTLKPRLKEVLNLPINTNRRFLRSYLKTRMCPTEVVDAFMGHWARGEEPWGEYSTISYPLIIQELKKYIPPLLIELGFKAMRSRIYDA